MGPRKKLKGRSLTDRVGMQMCKSYKCCATDRSLITLWALQELKCCATKHSLATV